MTKARKVLPKAGYTLLAIVGIGLVIPICIMGPIYAIHKGIQHTTPYLEANYDYLKYRMKTPPRRPPRALMRKRKCALGGQYTFPHPTKTSFLSLPYEIRKVIYDMIFDEVGEFELIVQRRRLVVRDPVARSIAAKYLALVSTCHTVHSECIDRVYSAPGFKLYDPSTLIYLRSGVQPQRFGQITSLSLRWDWGWKHGYDSFNHGSQWKGAKPPHDPKSWRAFWELAETMHRLKKVRLIVTDNGTLWYRLDTEWVVPVLKLRGLEEFELEMVWKSWRRPRTYCALAIRDRPEQVKALGEQIFDIVSRPREEVIEL